MADETTVSYAPSYFRHPYNTVNVVTPDDTSTGTFATTAAGLSATLNEQYFLVKESGSTQTYLYKNINGSATAITGVQGEKGFLNFLSGTYSSSSTLPTTVGDVSVSTGDCAWVPVSTAATSSYNIWQYTGSEWVKITTSDFTETDGTDETILTDSNHKSIRTIASVSSVLSASTAADLASFSTSNAYYTLSATETSGKQNYQVDIDDVTYYATQANVPTDTNSNTYYTLTIEDENKNLHTTKDNEELLHYHNHGPLTSEGILTDTSYTGQGVNGISDGVAQTNAIVTTNSVGRLSATSAKNLQTALGNLYIGTIDVTEVTTITPADTIEIDSSITIQEGNIITLTAAKTGLCTATSVNINAYSGALKLQNAEPTDQTVQAGETIVLCASRNPDYDETEGTDELVFVWANRTKLTSHNHYNSSLPGIDSGTWDPVWVGLTPDGSLVSTQEDNEAQENSWGQMAGKIADASSFESLILPANDSYPVDNAGWYTRIGNTVTVGFRCTGVTAPALTGTTTDASNSWQTAQIGITGLPYTACEKAAGGGAIYGVLQRFNYKAEAVGTVPSDSSYGYTPSSTATHLYTSLSAVGSWNCVDLPKTATCFYLAPSSTSGSSYNGNTITVRCTPVGLAYDGMSTTSNQFQQNSSLCLCYYPRATESVSFFCHGTICYRTDEPFNDTGQSDSETTDSLVSNMSTALTKMETAQSRLDSLIAKAQSLIDLYGAPVVGTTDAEE